MSWTEIIELSGLLSTLMGGLITAATMYLRMYIRSELRDSEDKLLEKLHAEFMPRLLIDVRMEGLSNRLSRVETVVDELREIQR